MFGMGPSELVIIGVLFLLIFGPDKIGPMAREVGKFVGQARGAIDEFKSEIGAEDSNDRKKRDRERNREREPRNTRSSEVDRPSEKPREVSRDSKGDEASRDEEYDL